MSKAQALHDVILLLVDSHHRARVSDLLDALEEEIGAATLSYAARIIQTQVDDAPLAYSDHTFVHQALTHAVRTLRLREWNRDDVLMDR